MSFAIFFEEQLSSTEETRETMSNPFTNKSTASHLDIICLPLNIAMIFPKISNITQPTWPSYFLSLSLVSYCFRSLSPHEAHPASGGTCPGCPRPTSGPLFGSVCRCKVFKYTCMEQNSSYWTFVALEHVWKKNALGVFWSFGCWQFLLLNYKEPKQELLQKRKATRSLLNLMVNLWYTR